MKFTKIVSITLELLFSLNFIDSTKFLLESRVFSDFAEWLPAYRQILEIKSIALITYHFAVLETHLTVDA